MPKQHTITLIPGDGIGPEVTNAVVRILEGAAAASWTIQAGHRIEGCQCARSYRDMEAVCECPEV